MERVSIAGWLPLEVETLPEARERAEASLMELFPVAHEACEEIGQKLTDGAALFSRHHARFAEQVNVDSQTSLWSSCRSLRKEPEQQF